MIARQHYPLPDGKFLLMEATNARTVKITTDSLQIVETPGDSKKLAALEIADFLFLDTKDDSSRITFNIKEGHALTYSTKFITKQYDGVYLVDACKFHNCNYFILPMLGLTREEFAWDHYFINSFLVESFSAQLNLVALKYRFYSFNGYPELEKRLLENDNFLKRIETDPQTVTFVFKVPEEHETDYELLGHSKYSQFSKDFKAKIMRFHHFNTDGEMDCILNKHPRLQAKLELEFGVAIPDHVELFEKIGVNQYLLLED